MTTPKVVTVEGQQVAIPKLTVQQIISLNAIVHEKNRIKLIEDLKAAEATTDEKLAALREHRKEEGLTSVIVRSAFALEGALAVLDAAFDGEMPESIKQLDPTELTELALSCFGITITDTQESAKGN